jgi:hypothetical protein
MITTHYQLSHRQQLYPKLRGRGERFQKGQGKSLCKMILEPMLLKTKLEFTCFAILVRRKVTTFGFWNQINTSIFETGCNPPCFFFETQITSL